ncbi:MAG: hypothetical protein JRE47_07580 [Deltaproteobacteria bacterium]|nr:hypothetical protein [Deltaproteobacteria bacterium]
MEKEILRVDPKARVKKTLITIVTCFISIATILVFLLFGQLLKNYLDFGANRKHILQELVDIQTRLDENKTQIVVEQDKFKTHFKNGQLQLAELNDTIAAREAKIESQQSKVNEYDILTEKVRLRNQEYQALLDKLRKVNENFATAKGDLSGKGIEISALEKQKEDITKKINEFENSKNNAKQSIVQLNSQISTRKLKLASIQSDISKKNNDAAIISGNFDIIKKEYQLGNNNLQQINKQLAGKNITLAKIKDKTESFEEQKKVLEGELKELSRLKIEFEQSMATQKDAIVKTKKILADATVKLISENDEIEIAQKKLAQLEIDTAKIKEKYDTLSVQVILAQETVKAKNREKKELETVFLELRKKQADFSLTISQMEETKINIESQIKAVVVALKNKKDELKSIEKKIEANKSAN